MCFARDACYDRSVPFFGENFFLTQNRRNFAHFFSSMIAVVCSGHGIFHPAYRIRFIFI